MATKDKTQERRRQARRQARKRKKRQERRQKRQRWATTKAARAEEKLRAEPRAAGHLMERFWHRFQFDKVVEGFKQVKYKGLSLATLFLVLMLFGMMDAQSDSDLCDKVRADPLLVEMCGVELLDRQQLYRMRKRLSAEQYDEWQTHLLRGLQQDPRTASRRDGVIIGDDTVLLKYGEKMPDITVVYSSSEDRYGLGYAMPSTHYADADKDYPLFGKLHYRTPEQKQTAEDKRLRRRKKLDLRRTEDEKAWLKELVDAERQPEVVVLRGSRLSPGMTAHCESLHVPWLGVSPNNRKYRLPGKKKAQSAKTLLKQKPKRSQWQRLNDEGVCVAFLGQAETTTLGWVTLMMVERVEAAERQLCVLPRDTDQATAIARLQAMLTIERPTPENSKLHDMLDLLRKSCAFILAETLVVDAWFLVPWFFKEALQINPIKRVVTKAKSNRSYTAKGQTKTWKEWASTVKTYQRCTVLGKDVNLAWLKVQDPDLGKVQLVFVQEIRKCKRNGQWVEEIGQCYALLCTDPKYKSEKVFQAYKLRWKIEEFYREVRQHHGLTRFHGRNVDAIHGHLIFTFISYICVALARLWNRKLKDKTLGWIKKHLFRAVVKLKRQGERLLIGFDPDWMDRFGLPDFCGP
jgi:hypothetical protein